MPESVSLAAEMESLIRELRTVPCDERIREILAELKSSELVKEVEREQNEIQLQFLDEDDEDFDEDEFMYADIALAYYNHKHGTDYKIVHYLCDLALSNKNGLFRHCTFRAAANQTDYVPQRFFAVMVRIRPSRKHVVLSCIIVNAKRIGCCCDSVLRKGPSPFLQDGPSCRSPMLKSDDEKPKVDLPRTALAYYNKRRNENYELVEALGMYGSVGVDHNGIVVHLNFKAKTHSPGHHDSDTKIFFAELFQVKIDVWKVLACCILGSKRNAGCHMCEGPKGKKILHPCGRFRYGSHEHEIRCLRKLPGRT